MGFFKSGQTCFIFPKIGEVVSCPLFADGHVTYLGGDKHASVFWADGVPREEFMVARAAGFGAPKVNTAYHDDGRGTAHYVIVDRQLHGQVLVMAARRLTPDHQWDPHGEIVMFAFQESSLETMQPISMEKVLRHGKMEMMFTWSD